MSAGFGYVVCQPDTDETSEAAMAAFQAGQDFMFMTKDSGAMLRPVAFGCRCCRGNEVCLHSHLGEGFAGDWAINKNRTSLEHGLSGSRIVTRFDSSYPTTGATLLFFAYR